jgi:ribosomal-protein-alanine N-acetyltransferase
MNMTTIRPMRVDDLPTVQIIDKLSFSSPWPINAFRIELLENKNGHCWVAEQAGRVIGLIVCWLVVDEIHIATIAVHPDFRRQGIGTALIATGLQNLIPRGAVSATLEVRAGNITAQEMYRHFRFKTVGRRKAYYKDTGEDALLMTADLSDKQTLDRIAQHSIRLVDRGGNPGN